MQIPLAARQRLPAAAAPIVSSPVPSTAVDAGRCCRQWYAVARAGFPGGLTQCFAGSRNDSKMTAWQDSLRQVQGRIGPGAGRFRAGGGSRCWPGAGALAMGIGLGQARLLAARGDQLQVWREAGERREAVARLRGRCRRWSWTACWSLACVLCRGCGCCRRRTSCGVACACPLQRPTACAPWSVSRSTGRPVRIIPGQL